MSSMFPSRYLIRFDDICPSMNWGVWAEIECCLRAYNVRPILGVVPRNRDNKLVVGLSRRDFWERVREWQSLGWSIGLHGYEHRKVTDDGGLVNVNTKSEFAGVDPVVQFDKLATAVQIFRAEGVHPDIWVAPWHSFDLNTINALKRLSIDCISDGFGVEPWADELGMLWVPQQQWRFRWVPFGVWTVCHHHNRWSRRDLDMFIRNMNSFAAHLTSIDEIRKKAYGRRGRIMEMSATILRSAVHYRQRMLNRHSVQEIDEGVRYFD